MAADDEIADGGWRIGRERSLPRPKVGHDSMKIQVTFYGGLKQEVGSKQQIIELPGELATVATLAEALQARYPALAPRLATVAYAVGDTLVGPEHPLRDGDEAALLPPVSGG